MFLKRLGDKNHPQTRIKGEKGSKSTQASSASSPSDGATWKEQQTEREKPWRTAQVSNAKAKGSLVEHSGTFLVVLSEKKESLGQFFMGVKKLRSTF